MRVRDVELASQISPRSMGNDEFAIFINRFRRLRIAA